MVESFYSKKKKCWVVTMNSVEHDLLIAMAEKFVYELKNERKKAKK